MGRHAGNRQLGGGHEGKLLRLRRVAGQHSLGGRPLQGEERAVAGGNEGHAGRQVLLDPGEVEALPRRVDDEIERAVVVIADGPRDHQVVDDAAVGVGELRIADTPGLQPENVAGNEALERRRRRRVVGSAQEGLAHVGDVEKAGLLPRMKVLGQDAGGILDRHLVAGERHHARAAGDMESVQRRSMQR